jgi:hypothetical protein
MSLFSLFNSAKGQYDRNNPRAHLFYLFNREKEEKNELRILLEQKNKKLDEWKKQKIEIENLQKEKTKINNNGFFFFYLFFIYLFTVIFIYFYYLFIIIFIIFLYILKKSKFINQS